MKEEKLTELEHWKMKGVAAELNALVNEGRYIESELKQLAVRQSIIKREFAEKQSEKEVLVREILERIGAKGDDIKFEIHLTNDSKCGIISYTEDPGE